MEKMAGKLLLENGIDEKIKEKLSDLLQTMAGLTGESLAKRDKEFHDTLVFATKNNLLITIMQAVSIVYTECVEYDSKDCLDVYKRQVLTSLQELSGQFVRDVIMKAPSANIMNALQKSVLTLYSYDENPDDISVANVLRQSLQLIGKIPLIAVYAYLSYRHFGFDDNLYIRTPDKDLSIAENILQMVRQDGKFTELEAKVLDIALVIHAEHGGGNNSTFTNHVVT